jgi:copper transport protein
MGWNGKGRVTALVAGCAVVLGAVLFGNAQRAQAHGYIVRSIPQDQSNVDRAPSRVQIWFSEALEPQFSTLGVYNQSDQQIDLGGGGVESTDHARLSVRLPPNLPNGAYIARFRVAFTSDGHITTDQIVFWVGQRTGSLTESGAGTSADPLEVVARALSLLGAFGVFGVLFSYCGVFRPAWHDPHHRAGGLAPRIMTALYQLTAAAIVLALIGSVVWLLQQSMALFNTGLGQVLAQGLWGVVAVGTDFGDVWRVRVVLLIGIAAVLGAAYWIRARRPGWIFPLWSIAAAIAGLTLGTFSLSAHAAGSTLWPLFSIGVDWLHMLANGAWIGGLIALLWVLRTALPPLDVEARRLALLAVLRRFSAMAVTAVALMIVTGAYSALANVYTPPQMVDTGYGRTLIAKLALIAPLLAIAWVHNRAMLPGRFRQAEGWISRTLRAETIIGVGVIGIAALLSATPPPAPPNARAAAPLPTYTGTNGALTLTLSLNPSAIGSNSYDVLLSQAGQPLDGARVTVTFVYPALGKRSALIALDAEDDGLYGGAGDELNRAGNWQALIDVRLPNGAPGSLPIRIALMWSVLPGSASGTARQPTVLNWASLLGIVGVLAIWLIPIGRKRAQALRLDPQSVVIGVAALAFTVLVLVGGGLYLQSVNAATEAVANPPPPHVNPVLPDEASLDAGRQLYTANCESCHAMPGVPTPDAYVNTHSDSDLYNLYYSKTHPYGADLTDAERWALVNYLRARAAS